MSDPQQIPNDEKIMLVALIRFYANEIYQWNDGETAPSLSAIEARAKSLPKRMEHLILEHVGAWDEKHIKQKLAETMVAKLGPFLNTCAINITVTGHSPKEELLRAADEIEQEIE